MQTTIMRNTTKRWLMLRDVVARSFLENPSEDFLAGRTRRRQSDVRETSFDFIVKSRPVGAAAVDERASELQASNEMDRGRWSDVSFGSAAQETAKMRCAEIDEISGKDAC